MRSAHDGFNLGPRTLVRESTTVGGTLPWCVLVVVGPVARDCVLASRCKLSFCLADLVWTAVVWVISIWFRPGSALAWFITLLCSLPSLILLPPLFRATFDGLSLGMTAPIMILVVLFAGTLVPLGGSSSLRKPNIGGKSVASAQPQLAIEHS